MDSNLKETQDLNYELGLLLILLICMLDIYVHVIFAGRVASRDVARLKLEEQEELNLSNMSLQQDMRLAELEDRLKTMDSQLQQALQERDSARLALEQQTRNDSPASKKSSSPDVSDAFLRLQLQRSERECENAKAVSCENRNDHPLMQAL